MTQAAEQTYSHYPRDVFLYDCGTVRSTFFSEPPEAFAKEFFVGDYVYASHIDRIPQPFRVRSRRWHLVYSLGEDNTGYPIYVLAGRRYPFPTKKRAEADIPDLRKWGIIR